MFLDYYDFPKIPLNRIFCSEPIANPVEALDTFSACAFTPSPCLRPSCRGPSSPKEFKPQHHTAIVIKTKITICIHLTISSSSSLIQDTQLSSQEKSATTLMTTHWLRLQQLDSLHWLHSHMSTCLSHQLTHFSAVGPRLWRAGMGFDTGSHYNRSPWKPLHIVDFEKRCQKKVHQTQTCSRILESFWQYYGMFS